MHNSALVDPNIAHDLEDRLLRLAVMIHIEVMPTGVQSRPVRGMNIRVVRGDEYPGGTRG